MSAFLTRLWVHALKQGSRSRIALRSLTTRADANELAAATAAWRKEIEVVNQLAMTAFKNNDAKAIAALYTEDCKIMIPGERIKEGRDAVVKAMEDSMKQFDNFNLDTDEVVPLGEDTAYEIGYCHRQDCNSELICEDAKHTYMVLWRKVNGKPKLCFLTYNHYGQ